MDEVFEVCRDEGDDIILIDAFTDKAKAIEFAGIMTHETHLRIVVLSTETLRIVWQSRAA